MSRRHHGGRSHRQNGHARHQGSQRPVAAAPIEPLPAAHLAPSEPAPPETATPEAIAPEPVAREAAPDAAPPLPDMAEPATTSPVLVATEAEPVATHVVPVSAPQEAVVPSTPPPHLIGGPPAGSAGATAPQLRRFIKSRPYVPMHELRRRFAINGSDDDVVAIDLPDRRVFVGLPDREGLLLGELLRGGDVGYELSLDPRSPIVVGVYPMRPVPRP